MNRAIFALALFAASPAFAQALPPVTVSFTVSDQLLLAGIHYAAGLYNAALPPVQQVDGNGKPMVDVNGVPIYVTPNPRALTDQQYATFIGAAAAHSWAKQKVDSDFQSGAITKAQRDTNFAAIDALP